MADAKREQLEVLLQPIVERHGLILHGIDLVVSRGSGLLRVYIDHLERHISVEDCEAVSRETSALLDVHDPIQGEYRLEVSSPGFDRPFFKAAHYARFVGAEIRLETHLPLDGRKRFRGQIAAVNGEMISLTVDGAMVEIAASAVAKARMVPDYELHSPVKPGKKAAKPNQGKGS